MPEPILYFIGVVLPYISLGILIGGLIYRVVQWIKVPVPVRIPLTPAPITRIGVVARLGTEFISFRSLMKANKKLWLGGYLFHLMLALTFIIHLLNVYLYQSFSEVLGSTWFDLLASFSGLIFGFSLVFLLLRRFLSRPIKEVSKLPDYIAVILVLAVVLMGNYLRSSGVDMNAVRNYMYSLLIFRPTLPPDNLIFLIHYTLAMILFIYIPFSKISHLIGWILSPSRNMRNISRFKRHINPWNDEVPGEVESWEEYYERYKDQLEELGPGGERR